MTAPATAAPRAAIKYQPAGTARARLARWNVIVIVAAALALIVIVANLVVYVVSPGADTSACPTRAECAPRGASFLTEEPWPSPGLGADLGFSFDYDAHWFDIVDQNPRGVLFTLNGQPRLNPQTDLSSASVWVAAVPASQATPAQLLADRRSRLAQRMTGGLTDDKHSASTVLGPSIGYVKAIGGSYTGTLDSADGPGAPAKVVIIAAGDGHISVVFSYVVAGTQLDAKKNLPTIRSLADSMLSTFRWRP